MQMLVMPNYFCVCTFSFPLRWVESCRCGCL